MLVGYISRKEVEAIYENTIGTKKLRKILREIGILHRGRLSPLEFAMLRSRTGDMVRVDWK